MPIRIYVLAKKLKVENKVLVDNCVKAGITGKTYARTVGARALQDVVQREASVALGDHHVQSWQQIAEDVFGNALGNGAG